MSEISPNKKILILTANPTNTKPLRLSEEVRDIKSAWERSAKRNNFEIIVEEAIRPQDLRRALLENKPDFVHFSGHGGGEHGLALMGESGKAHLVKSTALNSFFRELQKIFIIRCVIFNACYSDIQAQGIYPYVGYVVGMNQKIGDEAARQFAIAFYDTLFSGESIETAFALGTNAIEMENIPEHLTPVLKKSTDNSVVLSTPTPTPEPIAIQTVEPVNPRSETAITLENADGQVPLNSPFYIERPPIESTCYTAILKSGTLIRIKAPRQMGKTSLMSRILDQGVKKGYRKAFLDLWCSEFFHDIDTFLRWFCANISEELGIEENLDKYWNKVLGSQKNCTNYFSKYILQEISSPVILGLDEVDQVFQHPEIAKEFFGLLRAWHERSKNEEPWDKLQLVIAHSKEVYIPLNIHQSPFNVGLSIELGEFNPSQVKDLVERHGLNWSDTEVGKLMGMIDGHPYLVRTALYQIASGQLSLDSFLRVSPTEEGLYRDHLYRHLLILQGDDSLKAAMLQVVTSNEPVRLEAVQAFKLRSMGLVEARGNNVMPLCNLYRLYFKDRLEN